MEQKELNSIDYRLKELTIKSIEERVREEEVDGEIRKYIEKVEIIKKQMLVRKAVIERKDWVKFGTKANEPRGLGKETCADDQISIQTTQDLEKADIEIVKRIKNLNTDKLKAQKIQKQLQQKDIPDKKDNPDTNAFTQIVNSNVKKNGLDDLASKSNQNEARLCIRNIILEVKEEKDEFKEKMELLIKNAFSQQLKLTNVKVNVDVRIDRRNDIYAYVFLSDKSTIQFVIDLLSKHSYNNCVLEVKDETNKVYKSNNYRRNNKGKDQNNK